MITTEELDFIKIKEPRVDFMEWESELSPINRPLVRIAETAQTSFTFLDLCKARAEYARDIDKAKAELMPAVFKNKVKNLKMAMEDQMKELQKNHDMLDEEIKLIENALDINTLEQDYQLAIQKKLQEEAKESNNT